MSDVKSIDVGGALFVDKCVPRPANCLRWRDPSSETARAPIRARHRLVPAPRPAPDRRPPLPRTAGTAT
jgi:hypothetical protein